MLVSVSHKTLYVLSMANYENHNALPWLDEELELFRKLRTELGEDPKAIQKAMAEEMWHRSLKSIKWKMRYKAEPEKKGIGLHDPMQILAICKPWGKPNVSEQRTTEPSRKAVRRRKD